MNKIYIAIPLAAGVGFLIFPFVVYFGNDIMVVTSDSMLPVLKPHDLIIVQRTSIDNIEVGDIIAFDSHLEGLGIIAHRAIEKFDDNDKIGFDTQGDNVDESDGWTVHDEDLIGVVIDVVPTVGILLIEPVRYSLVAVIIITAISLLKEVISESKKTSSKTKSESK